MAVDLWVRCVTIHDTSSGRVEVLRGDEVASRLFDEPAMTATYGRHGLRQMCDRLTDGRGMSFLDPATLLFSCRAPRP